MKRFVIGDIHGGYHSLIQCLDRSHFNQEDKLIVLGDVCDGWPQTSECIDELLKIKNLIFVIGNHDKWFLEWCKYGEAPDIWTKQGGWNTIRSYDKLNRAPPESHPKLIEDSHLWYEEDSILFLHGGFNRYDKLEEQSAYHIMWDRQLFYDARDSHRNKRKRPLLMGTPNEKYKEVFIGHTTTWTFGSEVPTKYCEINNLDTGGGWEGKLTIMDLDTREWWQSDVVETLYPEEKGRR